MFTKKKPPMPKRPDAVRRLGSGSLTDFTGIWAEKKDHGQNLSPEEKAAKNEELMKDLQQRLQASKAFKGPRTRNREPPTQGHEEPKESPESKAESPLESVNSNSPACSTAPRLSDIEASSDPQIPPDSAAATPKIPEAADVPPAALPVPVPPPTPPRLILPPSPFSLVEPDEHLAQQQPAALNSSTRASAAPDTHDALLVPGAGKVGHYKAVTRVASEGEARPQPQSAMQFWKSRQKVSPADASTANPQEPKSGEEVRGSISPLKLYWERVNMKSSTEAPEEKFNGAQEREPSSEFLPKPAAPKASPTLRVVAIASNEIVGDPMDSRGRARGAIHDKPVGYQQWCSMMESATPLDLESSDDEVETHQETSQAKNELRLESKVSE